MLLVLNILIFQLSILSQLQNQTSVHEYCQNLSYVPRTSHLSEKNPPKTFNIKHIGLKYNK